MKTLNASFQVFNYALVERFEFSRSLFREFVLVFDLLGGEFHQVLVDDIADVFEVDCKGDDFRGAPAVPIIKAATGYLRYVELYRLVQSIDDVVHARDFAR